MKAETHTRVFWSGGSQAVRLPKALRLEGTEVLIRRRGRSIVIEPLSEKGWGDFWDRLVSLSEPVKRWKTAKTGRRKPIRTSRSPS
jgi:antitoxin VapB